MESFVFYEYYFLLFISVTVALAGFVFEIRTFYLTRREQKIDLLVATLFAEKIEEIDQYFPQKYRTLSVIIPALEKIQHKITNPYWDFFKEHILHHLIQKEIDLFLSSSSWKQTTLGLRALQLAPLPAYQSRVLSLLADSNDIVRFQAVRTAVALNTYTATKALIVTMLQMSPIMQ